MQLSHLCFPKMVYFISGLAPHLLIPLEPWKYLTVLEHFNTIYCDLNDHRERKVIRLLTTLSPSTSLPKLLCSRGLYERDTQPRVIPQGKRTRQMLFSENCPKQSQCFFLEVLEIQNLQFVVMPYKGFFKVCIVKEC